MYAFEENAGIQRMNCVTKTREPCKEGVGRQVMLLSDGLFNLPIGVQHAQRQRYNVVGVQAQEFKEH